MQSKLSKYAPCAPFQPQRPTRRFVMSVFFMLFKPRLATVSPSGTSPISDVPLSFSMPVQQPNLFPIPSSLALPLGLSYCPEAITPESERRLVAQIAELPFKEF